MLSKDPWFRPSLAEIWWSKWVTDNGKFPLNVDENLTLKA